MSEQNAVIAVYSSHVGAEEAVKDLQRAGIDMRTLSIVGKDSHTDEHVVGYYNTGDRMRYWGKTGAFWGASGDCCSGRPSSPFRASVQCSWRALGRVDRGRAGRRRCSWRFERHRRRTLSAWAFRRTVSFSTNWRSRRTSSC